MFETMEKEIESKFTDLLSLVNSDQTVNEDKNDLEKINSQLQNELDRQLENIEQVKEELDNELKKRNSIIEFDELDQNGYFSENKNLLDLNYFDTNDGLFQKNNCETIEEKDENLNEDEIDNMNDLRSSFFNLSRTNLNSVLEEDENEDSSQNNDLIDSINLNNLTDNLTDNDELNRINNELNNQTESKDNTLSPKPNKKNSNNASIANSSINNSIISESASSTKRNSLASITTANTSILSASNLNSSTNTLTSSTTAVTNKSIPNSTTSLILSSISQSVLNLDNLDNQESNVLVNNIIKKGVLSIWQLNSKATAKNQISNSLKNNAKKIFFSIGTNKLRTWKSRYFMLTENYILCFKKGNKSDYLSTMGKYQFKLNLLDDVRSINLNETNSHGKSYSIDINDGSILLFDKDFNLLNDWYKAIFKTRQRCELIRQEQELKFRKEKQQMPRKEILSEQIERRKLILSKTNGDKKVENLLDKFSEKFLEPKTSSDNKLNKSSKKEDDFAFEYLNNLRQKISGATSATDLNRSHSNLAQIKTNTPIISNRKRMSLQRKSLLSQFDSFLGSPLSHSSSKQQIPLQDNLTNLTNLAAVVSNNWDNQNCMDSPTMLPRIAPQCLNGNHQNGQLNKQNKHLTNSCSVFQFNSNNARSSPFTLNNSPALKQRSLYAERILSNSSLTLSNLSKFPNSRHSTLSSGTSFSNSLFKPFRESIHYATSLRKDNNLDGQKSHLKSATSEFSFIRLNNNNNSVNSTLNQPTNNSKTIDDDTLKRSNKSNKSNFNRMHSFANDCSDYQNSDQDLSIAISTGYNSDTLRNELKNSKTITNLNSELSKRTVILNPSDIGLGHLNDRHRVNSNLNNQLANNKHHYQKMKKINNSLDESDSTVSSSNSSSSSSSNNYSHPIMNSTADKKIDGLKRTSNVSYSPKLTSSPSLGHRLNINSPRMIHSPSLNHSSNLMNKNLDFDLIASPLLNQKNSKKNAVKSSKNQQSTDHTYQKVNNKRSSTKQTTKQPNSKITTNGNKQQSKKKTGSLIPVSSYRLNEPIYQTATSTEKRKSRMNKILENQSKIYVTMSDLK